jgi:hypothetical protein
MLTIEKKSKVQGEGTVTVKNAKTGTETSKQSVTDPLHTDGTLVGFKIGHTKNLGNYETVRIEVSLVLPTYIEHVDMAYKTCKDWADKKLTEAVMEIEADIT